MAQAHFWDSLISLTNAAVPPFHFLAGPDELRALCVVDISIMIYQGKWVLVAESVTEGCGFQVDGVFAERFRAIHRRNPWRPEVLMLNRA